MLLLHIVGLVAFTAALTRFLRQSPAAASQRRWLQERSSLLDRLVTCPHCLSFWISAAATAALWGLAGLSYLQVGVYVLLSWRGSVYANLALDRALVRGRDRRQQRSEQSCRVCGAPYDAKRFLDRDGLLFCSRRCWFNYLRARPVARTQLVGPSGEIIPQEIYPLSYQDVTPGQARELLQAGEGYVYVDVRSVPEFQNGHPAGAVNVPLLHREAMGMVPNPDFLSVMGAHFQPDTPLLIGCQSGNRSARAAAALVAAGFTRVANVTGGFGGVRTADGQVVERGWFELGLPVDYGEPEGRGYAALGFRRRGAP